MSVLGHAIFWIFFILLGVICIVRAFQFGEIGFDNGAFRPDMSKYYTCRFWMCRGISFIIFPLIDALSFFQIMPDIR